MTAANVKTQIQAILNSKGWVPAVADPVVATKKYQTAVGPDEAQIYLYIGRKTGTRCLTAVYWSDRSNSLDNWSTSWREEAPVAEVAARVLAFADAIAHAAKFS